MSAVWCKGMARLIRLVICPYVGLSFRRMTSERIVKLVAPNLIHVMMTLMTVNCGRFCVQKVKDQSHTARKCLDAYLYR